MKINKVKKYIPLNRRLTIVQPDAADMVGKIYIPDTAKRKPAVGVIEAIASDVTDKTLAVGQMVFFGQGAGFTININGKDLLMVHEIELLGKYDLEADAE